MKWELILVVMAAFLNVSSVTPMATLLKITNVKLASTIASPVLSHQPAKSVMRTMGICLIIAPNCA